MGVSVRKSAVKTIKELLSQWDVDDSIREINHRTLSDDILAISCCIHRFHDLCIYDFSDPSIGKIISKEDYELASNIRTYYQQKLLLSVLKGNKLSAFRTDLSKLVNDSFYSDDHGEFLYPESMIGLAYRLPEFYAYDIEFEKMFGGQYNEVNHDMRYDYIGELSFIRKLVNTQKRKSSGSQEFWFKNSYNEMVVIATDKNNKLMPFFEREITNKNIKVNADLFLKHKDNNQYYVAIDWKPVE